MRGRKGAFLSLVRFTKKREKIRLRHTKFTITVFTMARSMLYYKVHQYALGMDAPEIQYHSFPANRRSHRGGKVKVYG